MEKQNETQKAAGIYQIKNHNDLRRISIDLCDESKLTLKQNKHLNSETQSWLIIPHITKLNSK